MKKLVFMTLALLCSISSFAGPLDVLAVGKGRSVTVLKSNLGCEGEPVKTQALQDFGALESHYFSFFLDCETNRVIATLYFTSKPGLPVSLAHIYRKDGVWTPFQIISGSDPNEEVGVFLVPMFQVVLGAVDESGRKFVLVTMDEDSEKASIYLREYKEKAAITDQVAP